VFVLTAPSGRHGSISSVTNALSPQETVLHIIVPAPLERFWRQIFASHADTIMLDSWLTRLPLFVFAASLLLCWAFDGIGVAE
jgi:hypothetical protein